MANILVIGVGGGLGGAVARQLIARGDRVVGSVRTADRLEQARASLPGVDAVVALDLADAEAVRTALVELMRSTPVDAVVNCAAVSAYHSLEAVSLATFNRMLQVNMVSCLAVYQACIPRLRERGGRLVFTGSLSGRIAFPLLGPYQAGKFALEGLVDTMRLEAAGFGVKVVLVEPGGIDTEMSRGMRRSIEGTIAGLPADEAKWYGHFYRRFHGRLQGHGSPPSPEEVAPAVLRALDDADPEPRYLVGEDTRLLFERRHALSDREFDAFLGQI